MPAIPRALCDNITINADVQLPEELDLQLTAISIASIMCASSTVIQRDESGHLTCPDVTRLILNFCTELEAHLTKTLADTQ
ncbi:MAG: hypothetical protein ACK42D_02170 [Candidatus Paceibacteria bacterium]